MAGTVGNLHWDSEGDVSVVGLCEPETGIGLTKADGNNAD